LCADRGRGDRRELFAMAGLVKAVATDASAAEPEMPQ
jgi:hypothetical protein